MPDLQSLAGADLRWVRSGFAPAAFSLRFHEEEVGRVAWERLFTSRAILQAGESAWRIRRQGFGSYIARDAATDEPAAMLAVHPFGSGELTFADGRSLVFQRASLLPSIWVFRDQAGTDVVSVRGHLAALFRGGECRIEPAGASLPEVGLVALTGIYTLVRRARRRARR